MNKEKFIKEITQLDIKLTELQQNQLEQYYQLLVTENEKYNLTSITEKELVYLKHFYDSLTITKIIDLNSQALCDIGTGAGFPGLVLKIAYPNLEVTLVESNQKKCHFLEKVIQELKLQKIEVINERAEIYSHKVREKFDIVTSRAVAPLAHLLEYSIPLVKVQGMYIAMKSDVTKELEETINYEKVLSIQKQDTISFYLPVENSLRTLIRYQKLSPTNPKYPRKYNEIKKKSL